MSMLINPYRFAGGGGGASYDDLIADANALALVNWKMDETAGTTLADATGNGRTAALVNGPVVGQGSLLGNGTGKSVLFDGVDDIANRAWQSWLNVSSFTFMLRMQPAAEALNPTDATFIMGRDAGSSWRHYSLQITTAKKLRAVVWNTAGTQFAADGTTTLVAGTTYTAGMVFDQTAQTLKVFLNGVAETTVSTSGTIRTSDSAGLVLGATEVVLGAPSYYYAGLMSRVSMFAVAMSDSDMAAFHAAAVAA